MRNKNSPWWEESSAWCRSSNVEYTSPCFVPEVSLRWCKISRMFGKKNVLRWLTSTVWLLQTWQMFHCNKCVVGLPLSVLRRPASQHSTRSDNGIVHDVASKLSIRAYPLLVQLDHRLWSSGPGCAASLTSCPTSVRPIHPLEVLVWKTVYKRHKLLGFLKNFLRQERQSNTSSYYFQKTARENRQEYHLGGDYIIREVLAAELVLNRNIVQIFMVGQHKCLALQKKKHRKKMSERLEISYV